MTRTNIRRTGDTPCVACTLTTPGVLPCSKSMTALAQGRNSGSDSITATPGFVKLEKKIKRNGLCCKLTEPMRADTVRAVISGSSWTPEGPLSQELKARMASGLLPKTIVDYTREAYTFPAGNVRVTLDYDIRSGLDCTALFDADCTTVPVPGYPAILEVKWDEFLPDIVRDAVALRGIRTGAFSKYAAYRAYG